MRVCDTHTHCINIKISIQIEPVDLHVAAQSLYALTQVQPLTQ